MKKLTIILAITFFGFAADAQTTKSKSKNGTTKVKHKTSTVKQDKNVPASGKLKVETSETIEGTVPAGGLPATRIITYDSTYYDESRYNPYRKFTPAESVPEDPAPGLEDAGAPRNRLPNTDQLNEPRK